VEFSTCFFIFEFDYLHYYSIKSAEPGWQQQGESVMEVMECDLLVVGSGAAGLRAAIGAKEAGQDVLVLSRGFPGKATCTGLSGGVISAGTCVQAHLERTLLAGRGINRRELVQILCEDTPERIEELLGWGMQG
jgi:fumarate reductase (CoM/CoB) subunit A